MEAMGGLLPVAVLLLAVVLGCCLWFSWRGTPFAGGGRRARHFSSVAAQCSCFTTGFTPGAGRCQLNRREQLRRLGDHRPEDTARTDWIAGVSHTSARRWR